MNEPFAPFIGSVFHPTDFSEASHSAFAHALAIALVRQASLTLLHAGDRVVENWQHFPRVRNTLERWGLLEPGSDRRDVAAQLSVPVTKIDVAGNARKACVDYLASEEPDLVVVATGGRDGLARWLHPSKAQQIARRTSSMTLFVPAGCRPMVALDDGHLSLSRILVPVDHTPSPALAITRATRVAKAWGDPNTPVEITLLHVGATAPKPTPRPSDPAWTWRSVRSDGEVIEQIVAASRQCDLLVMPTDGRDGFLDVFRGSHSERVVRQIDCPLLSVPSD